MNAAPDQLRAFVERVERIEEEIKDLNRDKSEIYSEAKGNGFDVPTIKKVVRARKLDQSERQEQDALFDLYMSALGMVPADEPSHVRVHEGTGSHPVNGPTAPPARDADSTPSAGMGGEADRQLIHEDAA